MTDCEELREPALRVFFRLAEEWSLSEQEQSILLASNVGELGRWRQGIANDVGADVLTRVSLLLGIYKALHTLFADRGQANAWLRRNHVAGEFLDTTALGHMLSNGLPGMQRVHGKLVGQLE
ncbi:hypothetical protein [Stenotrophomonas sp.]|uniref:hypothetical protein n=1 Tax=Stenotrophomonas sp. TaxID=69392 RepID=UPI0028AA5EFF|nr:hypothetical protein [Stenotrophomonas sp.]